MSKTKSVFKVEVTTNIQKTTYYVDKAPFVVGRHESCDVIVNDINVSREHLRIEFTEQGLMAIDLGSSNGTMVNGSPLIPNVPLSITEKDTISFRNSESSIKVSCLETSPETNKQLEDLESQIVDNPINLEISGYPKTEHELKLEFKSVGLDIAKIKTPAEQAQAVIREAEYIKHSLIKSAEAQQQKIVNNVRLKTRELSEESYRLYREKVTGLINETKSQLTELRVKTETHLEEKKRLANEEIEQMWREHKRAMEEDRQATIEKIEHETELKMSLQYEQMQLTILEAKEKALLEADLEIAEKSKKYKNQFEVDEKEAKDKLTIIKKETLDSEEQLTILKDKISDLRDEKVAAEMEIDRLSGEIKTLTYSLEIIEKKHAEISEQSATFQEQIDSFNDAKKEAQRQQKIAEDRFHELSLKCDDLLENKTELERKISDLDKNYNETLERYNLDLDDARKKYKEEQGRLKDILEETKAKHVVEIEAACRRLKDEEEDLKKALQETKAKNKLEIEAEYRKIKAEESEKMEIFKVSEYEALQKIRHDHVNGIKKISLDLSQEIASKLELLFKSSENKEFNYEKSVELINSVIHVNTGADAETGEKGVHQSQINNWKTRNAFEKRKYLAMGFATAVFVYFTGGKIYDQFTKDSYTEQMRTIAAERQKKEIENRYEPKKVAKYFNNYVEATIYTQEFAEIYLDDKIQQQWVKKATYYFVDKWKVPEEKTIQVISNSKSLVQNVKEAIPNLRKDRLKQGLQKLTDLEKENIQQQAKILGSQVRYEAYKTLEKEFFQEKLRQRGIASE